MVEIGERESRSLNYLINEAIAEYVERHSSWGDVASVTITPTNPQISLI